MNSETPTHTSPAQERAPTKLFNLRPIDDTDRPALLDLLLEHMPGKYIREDYATRMTHWWDCNPFWAQRRLQGWLVQAGNKPAGFVALYPMNMRLRGEERTFCAMTSLVVSGNYRGKGLARQLIEKMLADTDCDGFLATTANAIASRMCDKLGFLTVQEFPAQNEVQRIIVDQRAYAAMVVGNRGWRTLQRLLEPPPADVAPPPAPLGRSDLRPGPLTETEAVPISRDSLTRFELSHIQKTVNWHLADGLDGRRVLLKYYPQGTFRGWMLIALRRDIRSGVAWAQMMASGAICPTGQFIDEILPSLRAELKRHQVAYADVWSHETLAHKSSLIRRTAAEHYDYQVFFKTDAPPQQEEIRCTLIDGDRGFQL